MIEKTVKYIGIVFALASLFSLGLPLFSTYITDGEAWNVVIHGYNLAEFSPWGSIVLISPIVLLGLMLSKLNDGVKTIELLTLFSFSGVALHYSTNAAYKWVEAEATGYIETHLNQLIYFLLLSAAMVLFYIELNFIKGENISIKDFFLKKDSE